MRTNEITVAYVRLITHMILCFLTVQGLSLLRSASIKHLRISAGNATKHGIQRFRIRGSSSRTSRAS